MVKRFIFIYFKVLEYSKKRESFGNWFWSWFQYLFGHFPSVFLCSKHFIFSHLSYHIYPIYRILFLVRKLIYGLLWSPTLFVVFEITKSCNLPCICWYPSCVEVIVEVVFELVVIPLSIEEIVGVLALSLIPLVWGDCWLAKCPSL